MHFDRNRSSVRPFSSFLLQPCTLSKLTEMSESPGCINSQPTCLNLNVENALQLQAMCEAVSGACLRLSSSSSVSRPGAYAPDALQP